MGPSAMPSRRSRNQCEGWVQLLEQAIDGYDPVGVTARADRILMPVLNIHFGLDIDSAAASSFAFGLRGLSSAAKTRRLSRSES